MNWKLIVVFIIIYLVFTLGLFPFYISDIQESYDSSFRLFDIQFGYSLETVDITLARLGSDGIAAYRNLTTILDSIYPIICFFLFSILLLSLSKLLYSRAKWYLIAIPFLSLTSDYLENYYITSCLDSFPYLENDVVILASMFTKLKWCLIVTILGIILYLSIRIFIKHQRIFESLKK